MKCNGLGLFWSQIMKKNVADKRDNDTINESFFIEHGKITGLEGGGFKTDYGGISRRPNLTK